MRQLIIRFLEFVLAQAKVQSAGSPSGAGPEPEKAPSGPLESASAQKVRIDSAEEAEKRTEAPRRREALASHRVIRTGLPHRGGRWLPQRTTMSLTAAGIPRSLELSMEAQQPPPGADPVAWSLERAKLRLTKTEFLLLQPSPEAIQEATFLVDEVVALVQRVERTLDNSGNRARRTPYTTTVLDLHRQLKRVRKLLEGAKRMQWARIRWIGSIVQTYTASGKARLWNPAGRTWTCEM